MHSLYSTRASVRNLKAFASTRLPAVSSSHLSEALAAAMGFRTHAALLKTFESAAVAQLQMPSNAAFHRRLAELGYAAQSIRWNGFPSLLARRSEPVETYRSPRVRAWRNLMVAGINEALRLRLFGFSPDENYWPGATVPPEHGRRQYAFEFLFNGRLPAVGAINDAGFGELSFHVAINVREPEAVGADGCGFDVADAYASGWLERTLGVWLQNGGTSLKCRRQLLATLAEADIAANGYSDRGKLMM